MPFHPANRVSRPKSTMLRWLVSLSLAVVVAPPGCAGLMADTFPPAAAYRPFMVDGRSRGSLHRSPRWRELHGDTLTTLTRMLYPTSTWGSDPQSLPIPRRAAVSGYRVAYEIT